MQTIPIIKLKGAKRLFLKLGSCSRTLGYILNREFGHLNEPEERALDPLAGGIIQQGYQCGMLWGSTLAAGAEAGRRCSDPEKATALAILTTQSILESFVNRAKSPDCQDITDCNWTNKISIAKYMLSGRVASCYKLLGKWAPEAIEAAYTGLSRDQSSLPAACRSCASEVVKRMRGSEQESIMVAGFASGIGLSGNACGALGAAIWMLTLRLIRENPEKKYFFHPEAKEALESFYKETDYEILCHEITGKRFATPEEHTEFLNNGGCGKLIDVLARS
jgi:hypothetical protein